MRVSYILFMIVLYGCCGLITWGTFADYVAVGNHWIVKVIVTLLFYALAFGMWLIVAGFYYTEKKELEETEKE